MRQIARCAMALLAGGCLLAGCQDPTVPLRKELVEAKDQLAKVQAQNTELQQQTRQQQEQVQSLQALGDKRLDAIPHVERIQIGEYSTGVGADANSGDKGVKVFVETVDQDGMALKAAGDVTVQLYDLAAPQAQNMVGQCIWPAEKARRQWTNGFLTQHFIFECPWTSAPKHDEITARVEFVDYMTGKKFSAQRAVKVALGPASRPASQPAAGSASQSASRPATRPATAANVK